MSNCIFVTNRNYLSAGGGGVQWCTRDYLDTLGAAGLNVEIVSYGVDQRWATRLRRKLRPRPFANLINPAVAEEIETAHRARDCQWIFLNNTEPLVLAADLKRRTGGAARIAYLSHGVESTDQINDLRLGGGSVPSARRRPGWIGRLFLAEMAQRAHLAGVICLSAEDVFFERWLGSENVCFLPRPVRRDPLRWQPVPGRLGSVATLSHVPNLDGLRRFAAALEAHPGTCLRVVGGPREMGERLAGDFRCVNYVGPLGDEALRAEAVTWRAFVNPIFCQARGASTKVATALGWGLPVLTTPQGARGYRWDEAALPRRETAVELAQLAVAMAGGSDQDAWQSRALRVTALAPDRHESGKIVREFLNSISSRASEQKNGRGE